MADRTMYCGDTFPPLRFSLVAGSTTLDMTQATSIVVHAVGADRSFSGNGTPISPFQTDPSNVVITTSTNGLNSGQIQYNLVYEFAPGDTVSPDVFDLYIIVQWDDDEGQQTFVTSDTLTVLAP